MMISFIKVKTLFKPAWPNVKKYLPLKPNNYLTMSLSNRCGGFLPHFSLQICFNSTKLTSHRLPFTNVITFCCTLVVWSIMFQNTSLDFFFTVFDVATLFWSTQWQVRSLFVDDVAPGEDADEDQQICYCGFLYHLLLICLVSLQ